ncbi:multicopper oxidase domain-containing protein, partial [Methylococcus capsulatus]
SGMGMHGGMGMGMMGHRGGMGMMGGHGGGMGMMMSMAHPIHLHGQSFQIVSRTVSNATMDDYASVRDGFVDSGWKDTVLAMPGERIRLIKPFQDFKGLFMYHCHNLEHEDMGMMREFSIE